MVYLFKCAGLYKIGYSKDVAARLKGLQTSNPLEIEMVSSWPGSWALEQNALLRFEHKKVRGEWFDLDEQDLLELDALLRARDERPKRRGRRPPNYWPRPCHWCARVPKLNGEGEIYCVCGWKFSAPNDERLRFAIGRGGPAGYLEDAIRVELPAATH